MSILEIRSGSRVSKYTYEIINDQDSSETQTAKVPVVSQFRVVIASVVTGSLIFAVTKDFHPVIRAAATIMALYSGSEMGRRCPKNEWRKVKLREITPQEIGNREKENFVKEYSERLIPFLAHIPKNPFKLIWPC